MEHSFSLKVHDLVHKSTPLVTARWVGLIHSISSHPMSLRYILVFSFHLRLGLGSDLFFKLPITNSFSISLLPLAFHVHRASHAHWFDHPNDIRCAVHATLSSSIYNLLHPTSPKYCPQHPFLQQINVQVSPRRHVCNRQQAYGISFRNLTCNYVLFSRC